VDREEALAINRTLEEIPYTNAERDAIDVTRFPAPRWVPS
jgi:hypothetical protein